MDDDLKWMMASIYMTLALAVERCPLTWGYDLNNENGRCLKLDDGLSSKDG